MLSGEDVCRILEASGFVRVRQRGSHVAMQRRLDETTVTAPVPMHREVRVGTLRAIIRQSGLPAHPFETE